MMNENGNVVPMSAGVPALRSPENGGAIIPYKNKPEIGDTASLHDLVAILKRHRYLILFCTLIVWWFSWIYCQITPKVYTATATLEIGGYSPVLSSIGLERMYGADTRKENYLKTTVKKLEGSSVADEVLSQGDLVEKLKVYFYERRGNWRRFKEYIGLVDDRGPGGTKFEPYTADPEYQHHPKLINNYLGLIDVDRVHETSLVELNVRTTDPALSQLIANLHARVFINQLASDRKENQLENVQVLKVQEQEIKDKITQSEEKLTKYAEDNQIIAFSDTESQNMSATQINDLMGILATATGKRIQAESQLEEYRKASKTDSDVFENEILIKLRADLHQAEVEHAALKNKVTPLYPGMIELSSKIESLKEAIKKEQDAEMLRLQAIFESNAAEESRLREQIETLNQAAHSESKRLVRYNIIKREVQSLRNLYETVLQQLKETTVSATSGLSNITINDFALLPNRPSAPRTSVIQAIGLFIGCIFGVGLALLLGAMDTRISNLEQAESALKLPFLGSIPYFEEYGRPDPSRMNFKDRTVFKVKEFFLKQRGKASEKKQEDELPNEAKDEMLPVEHKFVTISRPNTVIAESLRTIRTRIMLHLIHGESRVVMVTSACKGEGKTSLSVNLAVSLSQASQKTLLIEGDLRGAKVGTFFDVDCTSEGFSDYLDGSVTDATQVIRKTSIDNLDIVHVGAIPEHPAELIGSPRLKRFFDSVKEEYDYIIVDAPPVLPVSDSLLLSQIVDSLIFVVRSKYTERAAAQEALRRLYAVDADVMGMVLNDVSINSKGYSDEMFGSGSYYYSVEVEPKRWSGAA